MNSGKDKTIENAFEETVIRKTGLTPLEYFELGWKARGKKDKPLTWGDVINNKK